MVPESNNQMAASSTTPPQSSSTSRREPREDDLLLLEENDTNDDDYELPPELIPLKKGESMGPLKQETIKNLNGFKLRGIRNMKVLHPDAPDVLKDMNAKEWFDNRYLNKTFTVVSPKTGKMIKLTSAMIPRCLICAACNLRDRMIIVNWWVNLTTAERKAYWDKKKQPLRVHFQKPTVDATPQPTLMTCASGAAIARELGQQPKATTSIQDDPDMQRAFVGKSANKRVLDTIKNSRRESYLERPKTDGQVCDTHTTRVMNSMVRGVKRMHVATNKENNVAAYINTTVVIENNLPSDVYKDGSNKKKRGRRKGDAGMIKSHKILTRNPLEGNQFIQNIENLIAARDNGTIQWHYTEDMNLPVRKGKEKDSVVPETPSSLSK